MMISHMISLMISLRKLKNVLQRYPDITIIRDIMISTFDHDGPPYKYTLKKLFTSVSVASGGYLPRRKYPPLATSTSVNSC